MSGSDKTQGLAGQRLLLCVGGGLQFSRDHVRPLLLGATSALKLLALPLLAVLICRCGCRIATCSIWPPSTLTSSVKKPVPLRLVGPHPGLGGQRTLRLGQHGLHRRHDGKVHSSSVPS